MSDPRILIVDDDPDYRQLLGKILQSEGYAVTEAATGEKALESAVRDVPDVVLLDLGLPDLDGSKVLERLTKLQPPARVIVITGQSSITAAVEAMKLGACDFLTKPPEIKKLRAAIRSLLHDESEPGPFGNANSIVGRSPVLREVWLQVSRYAHPDVTILLTGESGTGKELFARAIHEMSKRSAESFIALDCATLPDTLVESELFGHEKGAFTGAAERRLGKFELANGGTILLDEIGNLPLHFQAKLLRVVQERTINRLGGTKPVEVDVRIISATNLDLRQAVRKGAFRQDLYYRLAEIVVDLPPLRERMEDIEMLTRHFIDEFNDKFGRGVEGISEEALRMLRGYRWPGNVRELQNVIKSSLLAADSVIGIEHLPEHLRQPAAAQEVSSPVATDVSDAVRRRVEEGLAQGRLDLKELVAGFGDELERAVIGELLKRRHFTQRALSIFLNIDRKTLRSKLQKLQLNVKDTP